MLIFPTNPLQISFKPKNPPKIPKIIQYPHTSQTLKVTPSMINVLKNEFFLRSRCLLSPYRDYIEDTKLLIMILQKTILR